MGLRFRAALAAVFILAAGMVLASPARGDTLTPDQRQKLQDELNQITQQIDQLQATLGGVEQTKNTLQGQLGVVNGQIHLSELDIKRRTLAIQALGGNIAQKQAAIDALAEKLGTEEGSLAAMLRATDRLDNASVLVLALTSQNISDFFADLGSFSQINERMQQSFAAIESDTHIDETQKSDLQDQLGEATALRQVQQLQERQLQAQKQQKNNLIVQTKGQEKAYQELIAGKEETAAQIRAALFQLNGAHAIPFGTALQYANAAAAKTGIRPAFLLGIIAEESNLGENVGTGSWQTDMSPANYPAYQGITKALGLDPSSMPVSKKQWYGWGGAMGPAQFIPNTWGAFGGFAPPDYSYDPSQDRIGSLTGSHPPNPWNPQDAFMAAALYLTDDGAAVQTPGAEFRAAMCYLASCSRANNPNLQFYGTQVASLAANFQAQINILNGQ